MEDNVKQSLTSQAIWNWREIEEQRSPAKPALWFSILSFGVASGVATLFLFFGHIVVALLVVTIAAVILFCSIFVPRVYLKIEQFFRVLSKYIGVFLTWLLLVPFFYLFFGGGRLIERLMGRDRLQQSIDISAATYWQDKDYKCDVEHYTRQF